MTYAQAVNHLQGLAIVGDEALVPAVDLVPSLGSSSVYRMISLKQIPAIKIAGKWKTTRDLFVLFWKRTMLPAKQSQEIRLALPDQRKVEIEEARAKVMGAMR